ncbi:MAG: hypothetical protein CMN73_07050 [Sphingomonas sp.]|nr:hypothetical protein [Sphingomonas sp.]
MKKLLFPLLLLVLGALVGGGAGFAVVTFVAPPPASAAEGTHDESDKDVPTAFVPAEKILAPLVFEDGRLSGYVSFDVSLEVPEDQAALVTARLPLLFHAINMRTYRTPLASGPDGMLPGMDGFRAVVEQAAIEAFGKDVVKRVAITNATPA